MGTAKRERQKAGRQARIAQAQAAAAKKKRTRGALLLGGLVVVLVAATLAIGAGGDDGGDDEVASGASTTSSLPVDDGSATSTVTPVTVAVTLPPAGEEITGETPCPEADGSSPRTTSFEEAPPTCIEDGVTYTATVTTEQGSFSFELDTTAAPIASNNFVVLARYHYYDGVAFHRIIPQFMIQGGDPTGPVPGQGGPGYSLTDELPTGTGDNYAAGTVAMANSGPDSAGSQFFVMATGNGGLPNAYTVFGHVTEGQDVVDAINALGDAASDGTPTADVIMSSVTITES